MNILLHIRRKKPGDDTQSYIQHVNYEYTDDRETVASALNNINSTEGLTDTEGRAVGEIAWDCSCLQKRCGACAMRIDGRPGLACDTFLTEAVNGEMLIEPLRKFRCIEDLKVDRSIMQDNLKTIKLYHGSDSPVDEDETEDIYEASRCLQCGLCLEVCPEFYEGGDFYGMATGVMYNRKLSGTVPDEGEYLSHIYSGCAKSLACRDVCPAGIDIDRLLVKSNRAAVWKRRRRAVAGSRDKK